MIGPILGCAILFVLGFITLKFIYLLGTYRGWWSGDSPVAPPSGSIPSTTLHDRNLDDKDLDQK